MDLMKKYNYRCLGLYLGLFVILLLLVGCAPPPAAQDRPISPMEFITNTIMFFLMGLAIYYLLVLKPEGEKGLNQRKFIENLKKNDSVVTTGGLLGRVVSKKDEVVTIEISEKVRIRVEAKHVHPFENGLAAAPVGKENKKK